jgi:hypothetical protein
MEVRGQRHDQAASRPGYQLGGLQRRSRRCGDEFSCLCRESSTSFSARIPMLYQVGYPGFCASFIIIIIIIILQGR